jgi:hypothetical protein
MDVEWLGKAKFIIAGAFPIRQALAPSSKSLAERCAKPAFELGGQALKRATRRAAGCGERGEATGAGAQDLICRATGEHATGAQPVQLALIPIEQVVDPNRQRLNVTIGGGDNVTANEWRSNWHRKA